MTINRNKKKGKDKMGDFTKEDLDVIWAKGTPAVGYDAAKCRLDLAGAMMVREEYGKEGMFGWEVDHVFPRAKLEELGVDKSLWDAASNLQPMNAKNNAKKGDDYPGFSTSCCFNVQKMRNEEVEQSWVVSNLIQQQLAALFGLNEG